MHNNCTVLCTTPPISYGMCPATVLAPMECGAPLAANPTVWDQRCQCPAEPFVLAPETEKHPCSTLEEACGYLSEKISSAASCVWNTVAWVTSSVDRAVPLVPGAYAKPKSESFAERSMAISEKSNTLGNQRQSSFKSQSGGDPVLSCMERHPLTSRAEHPYLREKKIVPEIVSRTRSVGGEPRWAAVDSFIREQGLVEEREWETSVYLKAHDERWSSSNPKDNHKKGTKKKAHQ